MAPPGRPYWETHDAPTAHGSPSWLSAGFQFLTGSVDPVALHNASREVTGHHARAAAEARNGEQRNAAISRAQEALAGTQVATATPGLHHLIAVPGAGDAAWYAAKAAKAQMQKWKDKQHQD